jgi:predicted TIM-barrel fold metal-dependent hydrolase
MERRTFLAGMAGAASTLWSETELLWGGTVLDTHLHLRKDPESCFTHMQGCGVTHAVLLTRDVDEEQANAEMLRRPGVFLRSVSTDPARPGAAEIFRKALAGGAVSMGELKYHLALDSPEMRRVYDIAAEMLVPVMMHIQTFPHFAGEMPYNTGYQHFDKILRASPTTHFIGHGDIRRARSSPAD